MTTEGTWVRASLGAIGTWTGGGTPSKDNPSYWNNGKIPWVSPKDMKSSRVLDTEDHITDAALGASAAKLIKPGAVLVVTRSGILDHTLPVAITDVHVTVNQDLKALSPVEGIDPEYVAWALRAFGREILKKCKKDGTTVASIEFEALKSYQIPIAPSREQQRIVEAIESYVSRLDAVIANLERVQAKLKAYRASVLKAAMEGRLVPTEADVARQETRDYEPAQALLDRILKGRRRRWEEAELDRLRKVGKAPKDDKWKARYEEPKAPDLGRLAQLPDGWTWASVEQLASDRERSIQSGPFGSSLLHSEFQNAGKLVIGIDNVQDGFFSMGSEHRISPAKFQVLQHYRARGGDVLITVMATVGRTCVVPEDIEDAIITKHVYRITPERALIEPHFLHLALWGGPDVRGQMFGAVIGQTRPGLNGGIIRQLSIPLPPRSEQARIVDAVGELLSFRERCVADVNSGIRKVARLRRAILKWAFEGKLVDQDPDDEPAEKLLARIRAERTSAADTKKPRGRKVKAAS